MSKSKDISFLKKYLKMLIEVREVVDHLCDEDFGEASPKAEKKAEIVARLADENGLDGSVFRDYLIPEDDPLSVHSVKRLEEKLETVPRIIAALEKTTDKSEIKDGQEWLKVPQLAKRLGCSKSSIYLMKNNGKLPGHRPKGGKTSTLLWSRNEIDMWEKAGCPGRAEWEAMKKRNKQGE